MSLQGSDRDCKPINDRLLQFLPASDVLLRCLHRGMAKKELNLFEFASCAVTESSASAAKVVRCEMFDADLLGISRHGGPDYVGSHAGTQFRPVSPDPPEGFAVTHSCIAEPRSTSALHQFGIGTVRSRPALPSQSTITQCPSRDCLARAVRSSSCAQPIQVALYAEEQKKRDQREQQHLGG